MLSISKLFLMLVGLSRSLSIVIGGALLFSSLGAHAWNFDTLKKDSSSRFHIDIGFEKPEQRWLRKISNSLSDNITTDRAEFYNLIKSVNHSEGRFELQDGSVWSLGWASHGLNFSIWQPGDRVKFFYLASHTASVIMAENMEVGGRTAVVPVSWPTTDNGQSISELVANPADRESILTLSSGHIFSHAQEGGFINQGWDVGDCIFVFHSHDSSSYDLFNYTKARFIFACQYKSNSQKPPEEPFQLDVGVLLELEDKVNSKVIYQERAVAAVCDSILAHAAGLHDGDKPIGVFLFLGPTGVGKTELAKTLQAELYKDTSPLLRFDMSHFNAEYAITRLIGSPPGYIAYDEGGQLTEGLKKHPCSVVLFDEIEKAHPEIHKAFLSLFDEGYLVDAHNERVEGKDCIFIMTSNLCATKINKMLQKGAKPSTILAAIEPDLIEELSAEFYNRLVPVIFNGLPLEAMDQLVEFALLPIQKNLKARHHLNMVVTDEAKEYLKVRGFHKTLGARPLKRLVQDTVVHALSRAILFNKMEPGGTAVISYSPENGWRVDYESSQAQVQTESTS